MVTDNESKRVYLSQSVVPRVSLKHALEVAHAIYSQFAGDPTSPLLVAQALGVSPQSSAWRLRTGAAVAFGFTEGAYNSTAISLTDLGRRAVAPLDEGEDLQACREAATKPSAFSAFFRKYNGKAFPRDDIALNVLEVECGVPREYATATLQLIKDTGDTVGFFVEIKGNRYVKLDAEASRTSPTLSLDPLAGPLDDEPIISPDVNPTAEAPQAAALQTRSPRIFIAHGKKRAPAEQVERMLKEWDVPSVIAVNEANEGRPISQKIADLMRECSAGIFIFTGDDAFIDSDGNEVLRPSQNVIYELGAASLLYGRRIVIFKESTVDFPSDFSDLGWIPFSDGDISAQGIPLLRELIKLGAVRLMPGA